MPILVWEPMYIKASKNHSLGTTFFLVLYRKFDIFFLQAEQNRILKASKLLEV